MALEERSAATGSREPTSCGRLSSPEKRSGAPPPWSTSSPDTLPLPSTAILRTTANCRIAAKLALNGPSTMIALNPNAPSVYAPHLSRQLIHGGDSLNSGSKPKEVRVTSDYERGQTRSGVRRIRSNRAAVAGSGSASNSYARTRRHTSKCRSACARAPVRT